MDLISNYGLGTATTVNKMEEMPYAGKPVTQGAAPITDAQGMKLTGVAGDSAKGKSFTSQTIAGTNNE